MANRNFIVWGYKPAYSKKTNELLKAFDLGIDGAFIKFAEQVTITISDNATEEQLAAQPQAIVDGYIHLGYREVKIHEVSNG